MNRRWKIWVKSALYRGISVITGTIVYMAVPKTWAFILTMCAIESVHYFQFLVFDMIWKRWIKYRLFERKW